MQDMCERALAVLRDGRPAREVMHTSDEAGLFSQMQLLSAKPVMYICNVDEDSAALGNEHSARLIEWASANGTPAVVIAAAIEAEHGNGPQVAAAVDRSHGSMGELQKETLNHMFAMRQILRPDQARTFDRAVVKALTADAR